MNDPRTPAAQRFARFVADVYELAGELERCGETVAGSVGQTGARWKVLSAASVGGQTVAQLARRLGLARQSVQRVADALEDDGLLAYRPNPDHQRAPYAELSAAGQRTLARLSAAAAQWEGPLAARLDGHALQAAREFTQALVQLVRQHPPNSRRKA
ncbi:MAG TPA: MarR family transcriptional regulator [Burkholderiales bacterium]|nr:MarR family transcriptional regulator [Burkholderiales bacterium]